MRRFLIIVFLMLGGMPLSGQNVAVSTNAVDYADKCTLNMEASLGIARRWSLNAGVKYNPFSYGAGENESFNKQRSCAVGARFWPWHIYSGWWFGGKGQYQEYSICRGADPSTREGDRYGIGLAVGYSKMLGKHINLDFGLGAWTGYSTYTVYACQHCGRVIENGSRVFLLPNDILLAVSYIF